MKKSGGLQWLVGTLLCLSVPAWGQNSSRQGDASRSEQARPAAKTGVINESQLLGLPMNGRSYTQLATLDAGISGDPFGGGKQGGNIRGIKVSGGRWEWNSFLLDGTDINDITNQVPRSAAGGQLGADTLLQVQVFSTNYGAQYGRAGGGVLNAITRSGSNDWHGTAFEFLRNSKLDAPNYFDPKSERPPFKRNQFGATLTGPIAKEHTFFMLGFEVLRNRLTETAVSFVPDNEQRIKAVKSVKDYVALYPAAQTLVLKDEKSTGVAENRMGVAQPSNEFFFTVRVDQQLGHRDAGFARYTFDNANTTSASASPSFPVLSESRQQYLTLAETHFFSPAFVNTARLSYTRPVSRSLSMSTIKLPPFFVPDSPQFGEINVPGLVPLGPTSTTPSAKVMNTYQAADDFIYSRGEHTWKWGMLAERFKWNAFDSTNMGGQWSFNSLDNFLQAGPQGTELRVALPGSDAYRAYRQTLLGFYLQDDYRVRPNLSFSLGLRYEFTTMIHDAQSRDVYLRDELRDTEPQVGRFMNRNPSLRNLAPRIGLSWSPWEDPKKLVIRAGFGIYYDQIIGYSADLKRVTVPFFKLAIRSDFDSSQDFPNALAAASVGKVNNQIRIFEYNDPKTPTVYRYNLVLEKEVLPGLTAEASYVGSRGNNLLRTFEANLFPFPEQQSDGSLYFPAQCNKLPKDADPSDAARCRTYAGPLNPAFSSIERTTTDSQSFYNAFLLSINRSLWHGLSSGMNYTFTKSVNESSGVSAVERHYGPNRTQSRGLDSGEVRHRLSLNYFYNLPLGSGGGWLGSGWRTSFFGGWRVGGILSVRTGLPEEPFFRIAYPGFTFVSLRPNLAPGRSNNPTQGGSSGCIDPKGQTIEAGREMGGPDFYFDPCAFVAPLPGRIGNAGRNIIVGPRVVNLDLSVQKNFAIDSQRSLQFRAEFFNIPNHPNFNPPERAGGGAIFKDAKGTRNPNAGRLTSTATASRQIQFALRLSF